jgi:hypothetical protein
MASTQAVTTASPNGAAKKVEEVITALDSRAAWLAHLVDDGTVDNAMRSDGVTFPRMLAEARSALAALPRLRADLRRVEAGLLARLGDVPVMTSTAQPREGTCQHCGGGFPMLRSDARYCSARCRVAAKRLRDRP